MTRYIKSWTQALGEVRESTEVKEAVVVETDYKYDGKVVKISKKNFSKVHKDYKNSTKGKETMLINDPKTNGTISVPVQFEEVTLGEVLDQIVEDSEIDEWVGDVDEIEESAGLQLKMAFDDAGIKIKGVKSGKLVVSKKDKKKVEAIVAKQMKKPADAKRVLGSQIVFEEVELEEEFWAVIDKAKGGEVMAVSSDEKGAKSSVKMSNFSKHDYHFNKDPKTLKIVKVSGSYKKGEKMIGTKLSFKENVELAEKGTAYPATLDTLRMIVKDKQNQTVMFKSGKAIVDLFTASAMVQVYDALKKPEMKKHFEKMIADKAGFMKTQAFAMKMIG